MKSIDVTCDPHKGLTPKLEEQSEVSRLGNPAVRILLVDDSEPWRRQICSMLQRLPEVQVIAEAEDGLEAVAAALELQPDLILLDLELPGLHGIEAARKILNDSPQLKILFVSQHTSVDVVQVALSTGAHGFLQKMDVGESLMIAVKTVMRGEKFVSRRFRDPIH